MLNNVDQQDTNDFSKFDPQWTEPEYRAGGARDDLGIETLSETITADLMPGINNATRRARYYSFWAWALNDFINDQNAHHTQNKFWEWSRNREDVLILAYLAHNCNSGLAGTTIGSKVWKEGSELSYDVTWKSLESVEGGSYQLYYRGVLEDMNITVREESSLHDNLSKEIGLGLAKAYGASVSSTNFVQKYLQSTQVSRADIEEFSQKGCICQVWQNELERQLLINAFFRFDTPDMLAVKRLATLCFLLDIIEQSHDHSLNETDFRTVFYYWSYGGQSAYEPTNKFIEPAQRWRIFQLRQIFVFTIESFWSLFLHQIQNEALSSEQYIKWLIDGLDLIILGAEWGIQFTEDNPYKLQLREFFDSVRNAIPIDAWEDGNAALHQKLNENSLINAIRSEKTYLKINIMAGNALVNLAMIYWRSFTWNGTSGWHYLTDNFAKGRMPIESFIRKINFAFDNNWSVAEWLVWLHKNYLWNQHRQVALSKLITRRQEVFKFEMVTDEPDSISNISQPRFKSIGVDTPKMNAPRFMSALNIMTDLKLITPYQSGYQLTDEGSALLDKFRDFTIPQWKEVVDDQATERTEETSG